LYQLLIRFQSLWQSTWDNQFIRRKCLVWFIVSVHSFMVLLLWTCGSTVQYTVEHWKEEACLIHVTRKQREKTGSQYPLQGHVPNYLTSFHQAQLPKGFTTSQWCHRLKTKPSIHGLWGTCKIKTVAMNTKFGSPTFCFYK
jgi:hypothetical protein